MSAKEGRPIISDEHYERGLELADIAHEAADRKDVSNYIRFTSMAETVMLKAYGVHSIFELPYIPRKINNLGE